MKKLIPADTVDARGNVWKTTGENIRNGAKEFSENDIKDIVDIIFPVGSIYCGENSFVLSVGTWKQVLPSRSVLIRLGKNATSGSLIRSEKVEESTTENDEFVALRMFERKS